MGSRVEELMAQLRREKVCDECLEHVRLAVEQIIEETRKETHVEEQDAAQIKLF